MTLTPESRVMLTDALRPPAGHRLDVAVGTTYSLNLTALLLAPLSFALFDQANADELEKANAPTLDPIRMLEAVRRHAEHTTVFCQAGGIHVPPAYRSILTFVEDSVVEVMPPERRTLFHPKIWALRFSSQDAPPTHRLVVLSRNMTLDRSWDTALVLDEDPAGVIDALPAADFVRQLPTLALRSVSFDRQRQVGDLADSLAKARLAAPSPFTEGRLLPIGMSDERVWPFPVDASRVLAISPFVTRNAIAALSTLGPERTLISRAESIDLLGAKALEGWDVNVLQRLVELGPVGDVGEPERALTEFLGTDEGLHAKTFVLDVADSRSMTITGSANLTGVPWGNSVEFDVVLSGPTSECGVRSVLDGAAGEPGLGQLLENYSAGTEDGSLNPAIETSYAIEHFHRALALSSPDLHVLIVDDERVSARLSIVVPTDALGESRVWLASLTGEPHKRDLDDELEWTIAPINVTPFIALETTAGEGDARVTRRCVIKATLSGAVDGRRQDAVAEILSSKEAVLRYLVFLLGDPSYDALFAQLSGASDVPGDRSPWSPADVALFEPLVRAAGRDEDALARVASLVEELRRSPNGDELVPDGFGELWDVVWRVHREMQSRSAR